MIASNYRKHADAMALQLPLPFGHTLRWALPRPGPRILRAIRVARAEAFKAAGRIAYPVVQATPAWYAEAQRAAKRLAKGVKAACLVLWAEVRVAVTTADTLLIDFKYEQELDQAITAAKASGNRFRLKALKAQRDKQRWFNAGCPRCGHQWVKTIPAPVGLGYWPECTNCTAAWAPDADLEQIRRELAGDDD